MSLKLKQSSKRRGEQWAWSVWLDGLSRELETIESVTYFLHPTFSRPVRVLKNRKENFRLEERGWGEFTVRAEILRKNGKKLHRSLKLNFDAGERRTVAPRKREPAVFLSSSVVDGPTAASLKKALQDQGLHFLRDTDDPNLPLIQSIQQTLGKSDAVIALLSDSTGANVLHEVGVAKSMQIPVIAITVGERAPSPESLEDVYSFYIPDPNAIGDLAWTVADKVIALSAKEIKQPSRKDDP